MEDLNKVSSLQLYTFWKNLSIGLLLIVVLMALSIMLPYYFSPICALIVAAFAFTLVYNGRMSSGMNCMVVSYALFLCIVAYSFSSILINILGVWQIVKIPEELSFFSAPYLPSLILCPVCFVTTFIIYLRRRKLSMCINCRLEYGDSNEKGKIGRLLTYESYYQMRNLMLLFGVLSVVTWSYYLFIYIDTDVNHRDYYIFVWLIIIAFLLDEFYFMARYYNLYLDLKDNNEIISPEELRDMTAKTYLRYYMVCGEYVYLTTATDDPGRPNVEVIDTPFFTKRSVNGITIPEVNEIIKDKTGIKDGTLKFFFGRKSHDQKGRSLLRYFYFINGNPEDYLDLKVKGEWVHFDDLKRIYSFHPEKLNSIMVTDITRMATIILTQKTFNEQGFRRNKLKSYQPTFTLSEIRNGNYDFQDNKWMRISLFNSDTKLYRVKRALRNLTMRRKAVQTKDDTWN